MGCSASKSAILVSKNHHHCQEDQNPSPSYPPPSPSSRLESNGFSSFHSKVSSSPKTFTKALSLQTPLVHHPPSKKGDTHHLVSLTSTTYGSLLLIEPEKVNTFNGRDSPNQYQSPQKPPHITSVAKTETQSNPVDTLSPDSVINTWELMHGLDDDLDCDLSKPISANLHRPVEEISSVKDSIKKPLWKHLSEESLLAKMDPSVASSYRRALSSAQDSNFSFQHQRTSQVRSMGSSPRNLYSPPTFLSNNYSRTPITNNQIVMYFTSLRGIRKTYEDCCTVRNILKGFRILIDERDISMDSTYKKELQSLLGGNSITLPQVFIRGNHIGGAEEIKRLNDDGELGKILQGFQVQENPLSVCEICGDARFLPCPNCWGSRKVFDEDHDQTRRCLDCNENGLIRCSACSCCY